MIKNDLRILPGTGRISVQGKSVDAAALFHRLEKVVGRVLSFDASGNARVAIKGQTLNVISQVPLKEGSRISLQVTGLSPQPVLRFLGEAAGPGFQRSSVLEHEVKMLLVEFMRDGSTGKNILPKLDSVVRQLQLVNREGLEQGAKMYIPLPMQLPDGLFSVAELLLQLPLEEEEHQRGAADRDPGLRATLLLDMSRLGPVRAEFTLKGKALEGMFLVTSPKARGFLEAYLFLLTDALAEKGFSIQQVGCFVRAPETVMQPLLPEVVPREDSSFCRVG